MFNPNNTCVLRKATATLDVRGERTYLPPKRGVPCAVVSLDLLIDKTSVRADSSGSRGRAEEQQGDALLLFPTYVTIANLDIVEVDGVTLEVISVFPRRNVLGQLDHFEVKGRRSELPS